MKRNKKLALKILRYARDNVMSDIPDIQGHDRDEVEYHVQLCIEAGFLKHVGDANTLMDATNRYLVTWEGHEMLDRCVDC